MSMTREIKIPGSKAEQPLMINCLTENAVHSQIEGSLDFFLTIMDFVSKRVSSLISEINDVHATIIKSSFLSFRFFEVRGEEQFVATDFGVCNSF